MCESSEVKKLQLLAALLRLLSKTDNFCAQLSLGGEK